jgi:hypothetical protein
MLRRASALLPLVSLSLLSACSRDPAPLPVAAAPVQPVPVIATPMPLPPAGASAGLPIPARLPDGGYATPNRDVGAAAAIWHLRAGFNVAVLTCTAQDLAPAYNRFLAQQRVALADAHKLLNVQHGGAVPFDVAMTRLYNYFAQPAPQKGFCAAATQVLQEATAVPAGGLAAFAPGALARLDRPFTDFYATYDQYREQLAAWRSGTAVASTAPRLTMDGAVLASDQADIATVAASARLARR